MTRRPASHTVLVYHPDHAAAYARLVKAPRGAVTLRVAATPAEAARAIGDTEILYAWTFPPGLYAKAPNLRWLQAMGAGVDWALGGALPSAVAVTRAPGVFGPWMREYVLGWCLWVTQRMEAYRTAQRRREWLGSVIPGRLRGKTMTIVGFGDVGRAIAQGARGLGMRVLGVSRSGRPSRDADRVYRLGALDTAIAAADFVVLATPLTRETQALIGTRAFAAMRRDAWLLNVARGPVVDEAALIAALTARRIGGAILDVFAEEPLPPGHALWSLDNVVVTPHVSGPSTPDEIAPIFNENLARYLGGKPLRHIVDRARGY